MSRVALAIILIALAFPAFAQHSIIQGGPWGEGRVPIYSGPPQSQPIASDSGPAGGSGPGVGEMAIIARGPAQSGPPFAGLGSGPYGTNFCDYDGPTTSAVGYHFLCFSANAQGGGIIAYGAQGAATPQNFQFIVNGQAFTFPFNMGLTGYLYGHGLFSPITASTTIPASVITGTLPPAAIPFPTLSSIGGVEASASVAHQWLAYIDTSGVPHQSQPAFTDISGVATAAQLPTPTVSTIGGVEAYVAVSHQWINAISTGGAPQSTQPAFTDISGQSTLAQLPTIGANTALGSIAGGTPIALTQTQLTSLINVVTASLSGALPSYPNNTTTVLLGNGTYGAVPTNALASIGALTVLCNASGSSATPTACTTLPTGLTVPGILLFTGNNNGSNWSSYTGNQDIYRLTINSFPIGDEFGGNNPSVPIFSGFVVGLLQPSNATGSGGAGNADIAGAFYSQTNSTSQGTQALLGVGSTNISGSGGTTFSTWGNGCVATNAPSQAAAVNTGNTNGNLYCFEADVNLVAGSGASQPNVAVRGVYLNMNTSVGTSNGTFNAVEVDHSGSVGWNVGYQTDDGSIGTATSNAAISIGQVTAGNNSGSQKLQFRATTSGGTSSIPYINVDPGGDFAIYAGQAGGSVGLYDSSAATIMTGTSSLMTLGGGLTAPGVIASTDNPQTAWQFDAGTQTGFSLASSSHQNLPTGSGLLIVNNTAISDTGAYLCGGGSCVLLGSSTISDWVASTTTPASGKMSVAYTGSTYAVYSNYGSTQTVKATLVRARNTN